MYVARNKKTQNMSPYTIHLRSADPELLVEFDLPPGTHARIGASPQSEITLPLGGIPPFSCIIGRFHDGRLYLADLDEAISRRLDLPGLLSLPPYQFEVFQPEDPDPDLQAQAADGKKKAQVSKVVSAIAVVGIVLGVAASVAVSRCGPTPVAHPPLKTAPAKPLPKSGG
jgi:hypothetical protein